MFSMFSPLFVGKLITLRTESTETGFDNEKISLYRGKDGSFFLKGRPSRKLDFPSYTPNKNKIKIVPVTDEWAIKIFTQMENSQISAFPILTKGYDGWFTELEIGGYKGRAYYRWWCNAPDSWKLLENIAKEIYNMFYDHVKHDSD